MLFKNILYPEPGSNRHEFPHWCLRPTRLPIPPSGQKHNTKVYVWILNTNIFYRKKIKFHFLQISFVNEIKLLFLYLDSPDGGIGRRVGLKHQ